MDKLKVLLGNGPRPRYHAARALVYLGELDMGGTSLFEPTGGLLSAQVLSVSLGGDREPGRGPGAWEGTGSLGGGWEPGRGLGAWEGAGSLGGEGAGSLEGAGRGLVASVPVTSSAAS